VTSTDAYFNHASYSYIAHISSIIYMPCNVLPVLPVLTTKASWRLQSNNASVIHDYWPAAGNQQQQLCCFIVVPVASLLSTALDVFAVEWHATSLSSLLAIDSMATAVASNVFERGID
jgi:hypothetical protein